MKTVRRLLPSSILRLLLLSPTQKSQINLSADTSNAPPLLLPLHPASFHTSLTSSLSLSLFLSLSSLYVLHVATSLMNSTLSSSPPSLSTTFFFPNHKLLNLSSPLQNPNFLFNSNSLSTKHRKLFLRSKFQRKSALITSHLFTFQAFDIRRASKCEEKGTDVVPEGSTRSSLEIRSIVRPIVYAVFCLALGFSPIRGVGSAAIAAPVKTVSNLEKEEERIVFKGHEYSVYTNRLLEVVSRVLKCIEEIRLGNEGEKELEAAVTAVREKKEELQKEIMSGLYRDLREWKEEKERLMKRSEEIVDKVVKLRSESEDAVKKGEKERVEEVAMVLEKLDGEYGEIWEKVGEIEDKITTRETRALSIGVREVCFIERECVELVKRFRREMQRRSTDQRYCLQGLQ